MKLINRTSYKWIFYVHTHYRIKFFLQFSYFLHPCRKLVQARCYKGAIKVLALNCTMQYLFEIYHISFRLIFLHLQSNAILWINFYDRAERQDLKSRFLLFILLFFFPLFLGEKRKGEKITKVGILSHAFLLHINLSFQ